MMQKYYEKHELLEEPEKVDPIDLFVTGCAGAAKSHLNKSTLS